MFPSSTVSVVFVVHLLFPAINVYKCLTSIYVHSTRKRFDIHTNRKTQLLKQKMVSE